MTRTPRILGAILATPPLTSGERTLARLELARRLLLAEQVIVANLLDVPTLDTGHVATLGKERGRWFQSRGAVEQCVITCDAVLLGFGVTKPSGEAGIHFQGQVDWLRALLKERGVTVYMVGGRPRHPSRWQRWTARAHPGVPFDEALRRELAVATTGAASGAPIHPAHHR